MVFGEMMRSGNMKNEKSYGRYWRREMELECMC